VGITLFEAYLTALLGGRIDTSIIHINDGAQIIKRVTRNASSGIAIAAEVSGEVAVDESILDSLRQSGYSVILYPNTVYNSDKLRIQGLRGVMEAHGKFNARGKIISDML